jgi:Flp pilus assembly protein TadB
MVVTSLAVAWGLIVSLPFAQMARRQVVVAHARALVPDGARAPRVQRRSRWKAPRAGRVFVDVLATPVRHRARRAHDAAVLRELPVAIDLLGVAVGAGCTPFGAVDVVATWCPPLLADALARVTRACRLGETFDGALHAAALETPALAPVVDALGAAARLGAPVAPTLARLSDETRASLRRTAEARARTVPVRLLFPLVLLILPAFGLLTVAPVLLDGFAAH